MIKSLLRSLAFGGILAAGSDVFAAYGLFGTGGSYVVVNSNGGGNVYYQMTPGTGTIFNGLNLGTFNPSIGQTLVLAGGEVQTYENNSGFGPDNVFDAFLSYRIYSGAPSGAFTDINLSSFQSLGGGDEKRFTTSAGVNMLSGLVNGTYSIQVYSRALVDWGSNGGTDDTIFASNGGNNYTATFSVVPEPSRAFLAIVGLGTVAVRRRRRA